MKIFSSCYITQGEAKEGLSYHRWSNRVNMRYQPARAPGQIQQIHFLQKHLDNESAKTYIVK
jgi:hypothetical protein